MIVINVAGTDGDRKSHDFRPTETIDIDDDWQRNERGVTALRGMDGTVIGKHTCDTFTASTQATFFGGYFYYNIMIILNVCSLTKTFI